MANRMKKSVALAFRGWATPGQVPRRDMYIDRAAVHRLVSQPPPPFSIDRMLARPIFSARGAVSDLGLDVATENEWAGFLQKAVFGSEHEGLMRQQLMERLLHEDWDPELRKVMFQRAMSLYQNAQKSDAVEIVTVDELRKAKGSRGRASKPSKDDDKESDKKSPKTRGKKESAKRPTKPAAKQSESKGGGRGGDFYRRVPKEKGGFRYYYTPEQYNSRADAHHSGDDVRGQAAGKELTKMIGAAGEGGCGVADFKDLVKKYGAQHVSASLKKECGEKGSMTYSGGRFYTRRG